jgi:hypothetical protein
MAHTRRKRRTKHRGNAAGMIEVRGRTGRPVQPAGGKGGASGGKGGARSGARAAGASRADRFSRPPTWRSAINRALIAAVFFGAVMVLLLERTVTQVLPLAAFMLVLYIPLGYYTDLVIFRRRQRGPKRKKP